MVTAGLLGADSLKLDGAIHALMNRKFTSAFFNKYKDGVTGIQSILRKKGFLDFGELFVSKIIDLNDILKLRNNLQNKLFRYWALNDYYDESIMQKDIMNSVHNILGSKLSNVIRFVTCSSLGLVSTIPGMVLSAFDSFIVNKIVQGWHPNFFLDDKLKETIDKCIKKKEKETKSSLLCERFKGIAQNNLCPCGSGKKFKDCHGK